MGAQIMYDLFVHRPESYTVQWYKEDKGVGFYRQMEGECTHTPRHKRKGDCEDVKTLPLTLQAIEKHLRGEDTIGIFQLAEDNSVKWGCIDIDMKKGASGDDLPELAKQQTLALARA